MNIRSTKQFASVMALALGAAAATASADMLQMNFAFTANGTLNGVAFTNKAVTITLTGDTASRQSFNDSAALATGFFVPDTTLPSQRTFSIAGVGSGAVNSVMTTATWKSGPTSFYGYRTLLIGPSWVLTNSIFSLYMGNNSQTSWDMQGATSALNGALSADTRPGHIPGIATSLGTLQFTSFSSSCTFSATAVPAPGAFALLGMAGLGKRRRR